MNFALLCLCVHGAMELFFCYWANFCDKGNNYFQIIYIFLFKFDFFCGERSPWMVS